jgi:hypothetical protein
VKQRGEALPLPAEIFRAYYGPVLKTFAALEPTARFTLKTNSGRCSVISILRMTTPSLFPGGMESTPRPAPAISVPLPQALHRAALLWSKRDASCCLQIGRMSAAHRTSHNHGATMQLELQHVDPHADPHDAIAAQLRELGPRLAHAPSEANDTPAASPEPANQPPHHAAPLNDNADAIRDLAPRRGFARGIAGLIVCGGIAAAAVWHSYGDEAKQRLSHLVPQLFAGTTTPAPNANAAEAQDATSQTTASEPAAEPAPVQDTAAAPATPVEPPSAPTLATAASTPAAENPPAQATLTPELAQSIETMTREIASLKQTVEQLQAGQQQLSRDVAKAAEQATRRKPAAQASKPAPPPRSQRTASPAPVTRSAQPAAQQVYPPRHTYSPQSAAQRDAYIPPPAPTQLPPQPGDTSVPRPPMPLR